MSELWKVDQEWASEFLLEIKDPEGWYRAAVRYDGCIDLYRYFNTPVGLDPENDREMTDDIHICDIDDFIARLQALKQEAHKHFGNNGHWKPDIVDGTVQPVPLQIEQEASKHE